MKKFSKAFGEVEVISQDATFTTIIVVATGEEKKLLNQYANLSDAPIGKVKKAKQVQRELTKEENERVSISVERQIREERFVSNLSHEARIAYKQSNSKKIHL